MALDCFQDAGLDSGEAHNYGSWGDGHKEKYNITAFTDWHKRAEIWVIREVLEEGMYELQLEEADFTGRRMGEESSLQGSAPFPLTEPKVKRTPYIWRNTRENQWQEKPQSKVSWWEAIRISMVLQVCSVWTVRRWVILNRMTCVWTAPLVTECPLEVWRKGQLARGLKTAATTSGIRLCLDAGRVTDKGRLRLWIVSYT